MISAPLIEYLKKGIFTILGLILAVYLFVILLTYTGNDPSWSHISSDMTTINNMGGAMGAWLSDLLYSFFGFGAWWLLVFIVYESILIWWENKPTFWPLRLISYVFLLLSASALFAQAIALIQHVADPVTTGLKGVAGGIVGLELQARLAQLLTSWGNLVFLTLFVIITATFAFNIHWQTLYYKLTNLGWLGSGIKDESAVSSTPAQSETSLADNQPLVADSESTTSRARAKKDKPDYGQLPLELQPAYSNNVSHAEDNSGRFGNVLNDFLAKSGLGASIKASMAEAEKTTEAHNINDGEESSLSTSSAAVSADNQPSSVTILKPNPEAAARKVEPSFAWNDAETVDDLLATEGFTEGFDAPEPPRETALSVPTAAPISASVSTSPIHTDAAATDVDELADAWLAEHEPTAVIESEAELKTEADYTVNEQQSALVNDKPAPATNAEPVVEPSTPAVSEHQQSPPALDTNQIHKVNDINEKQVADTPSVAPADMTPTNTPPANPKAAPTVESAQAASETQPTATKPTMSFAVPDGDASNHITDMMPDDSSPDEAPTMPDIHDDAAFAKRSRAMQTAEYRGALTPIPEISILDKPDPDRKPSYTIAELEQLSELLEIKLQEFNVKAEVVNAIPGPVVTRFEVDLAAGVKASKVTGISRDLARSLSMASLRVVEVIPGKPYIGIEVPNKKREMVRLIELLNTDKYKDPKAQISMAMGKDIGGNPIITDLARAPHMLVAGTTGSGKSVLVNSMLLSMLLKYTPNELRLILIDPKQLELANYNDIPHLLTPVVTDMTEAASSLSWCVAEMERRYQLMSLLKVRKLNEFNKKVRAAEKAGKPMLDPLWRPNDNVSIDQAPKLKTLPMIVIVADEFADMIMQVGKQAEELITRLAQKSRAAGIHLMLATQRPSVDVITGLIKANIPVRAALRVNSKVDSRTILDSGGAEDMLGNGDMLFLGPGQIEPDRVHGAYVSDEEVNRVCDAWRERGAPDYIDNMAGNFELSSPSGGSTGSPSGEDDDLYNDAVAFIMETRKVSASSIQRKFSIGYNRAARIVDSMEEAGLVSSMGKSGKRELLM
ncbi:DNA translocase FtsK 4TM domain-containing protein [Psychrobacter jeotgali]|uniref:DNA translocase FtsK 4TM domain-containing protein n=1 Tax=Psychrobacter jeotgali TaxID=179010 RepID=UPI001919E450|nr:DNA translocase FtsK 4TM domain-containing protein [Psychrobacter jeotgali]